MICDRCRKIIDVHEDYGTCSICTDTLCEECNPKWGHNNSCVKCTIKELNEKKEKRMANVNSVIIEGRVTRILREKGMCLMVLTYNSSEFFEENGEGAKSEVQIVIKDKDNNAIGRKSTDIVFGSKIRVVGRLEGLEGKYIISEYLELRPSLNE